MSKKLTALALLYAFACHGNCREYVEVLSGVRPIPGTNETIGDRSVRGEQDSTIRYLQGMARDLGYQDIQVQAIPDFPAGRGNVIVTVPGETPGDLVVIGAHHDSAGPIPAADDNASGVGAVLEAMRKFAGRTPKVTVKYVFFDGEEIGARGSRAFVNSNQLTDYRVKLAIVLDTIGSAPRHEAPRWDGWRFWNWRWRKGKVLLSHDLRKPRLIGGPMSPSNLKPLLKIWNKGPQAKHTRAVDFKDGFLYISDPGPFADARLPVLFIHGGFKPWLHRKTSHSA